MLNIENNIPLKNYSTFKIGGPAKFFFIAKTPESLQEALIWSSENQIPFHILGKGSNSLFDDRGFDGLVIYNKIDHLSIQDRIVTVGAGYSFSLLGMKTAKLNLCGLEFASGIPGSVGGAVYMNAGANGQETANCLTSVQFMDDKGTIKRFKKEELQFNYRSSSFHHMDGSIIEATFELNQDTQSASNQKSFIDKRIKTQPYTLASCGCVFRNPQEVSAGKLIDECGLKNLSVGGASVSDLHANFIVNLQSATASDVLELVKKIQNEVKKKTGIQLEHEIRVIPYQK